MNSVEKLILNELQEGIPLVERPFLEIANRLNILEEDVIDCLEKFKQSDIIRRVGGILDVNKIGIVSTLACMKVPNEDVEKVTKIINSYEGITHNYERAEEYNIWFTVMENSKAQLHRTIESIIAETEMSDLIVLPSVKKYKTKVYLKF
jgi:siroheme decarboxylase